MKPAKRKFMPDREALVRVVAAGLESLRQSRPRMNLEGLLDCSPMPVRFYLGRFLDAEVDGVQKEIWFSYYIMFRKGVINLDLAYSLAKSVRGFAPEQGIWKSGGEQVSQSEAERLAGSAFTHPYAVERVSDPAIWTAQELLDAHKPDDN